MLVLPSTALGANVSPPFLLSSVRNAFQSVASSVQSMLSPVVPRADVPGTSSEQSVADPAVSLQATLVPPPQDHPGSVSAATENANSNANWGANSREHSAVENANPGDGEVSLDGHGWVPRELVF